MGANEFDDPRVAVVYDLFDSDRSDLDHYAAIIAELGARQLVLDLGCGTGTLAIMLAGSGLDVVGADPSRRDARCRAGEAGGRLRAVDSRGCDRSAEGAQRQRRDVHR